VCCSVVCITIRTDVAYPHGILAREDDIIMTLERGIRTKCKRGTTHIPNQNGFYRCHPYSALDVLWLAQKCKYKLAHASSRATDALLVFQYEIIYETTSNNVVCLAGMHRPRGCDGNMISPKLHPCQGLVFRCCCAGHHMKMHRTWISQSSHLVNASKETQSIFASMQEVSCLCHLHVCHNQNASNGSTVGY